MEVSRRTVIKGIGAGIASAAIPASAAISSNKSNHTTDTFRIRIAHQWSNESVAAVIKNTSPQSTTITGMTSVVTDHGRFDFSELTDNGPLTLAAGEELNVPFTVMGTPAKAYGHFDHRLQKKIRESLVITTANQSAKVSITLNPQIV